MPQSPTKHAPSLEWSPSTTSLSPCYLLLTVGSWRGLEGYMHNDGSCSSSRHRLFWLLTSGLPVLLLLIPVPLACKNLWYLLPHTTSHRFNHINCQELHRSVWERGPRSVTPEDLQEVGVGIRYHIVEIN